MMRKQTVKRCAKVGVLSCIISIMLGAIMILADYLAVSPFGTDAVLFVAGLLMFPILLCILAIPIALITLWKKRLRQQSLQVLIFSVILVAIGMLSLHIGHNIRMNAFKNLARRSRQLVRAIQDYTTDHGSPPTHLQNLVPHYLSSIPLTRMNAYPTYEYYVGEKAEAFDHNPWVLRVFTPLGGINFDQFLYFPKQNYPQTGYGGWLEIIEDWAYVHE